MTHEKENGDSHEDENGLLMILFRKYDAELCLGLQCIEAIARLQLLVNRIIAFTKAHGCSDASQRPEAISALPWRRHGNPYRGSGSARLQRTVSLLEPCVSFPYRPRVFAPSAPSCSPKGADSTGSRLVCRRKSISNVLLSA